MYFTIFPANKSSSRRSAGWQLSLGNRPESGGPFFPLTPQQRAVSDQSILAQVKDSLFKHGQSGGRYALLETAGGVLSPGPSGSVQADLYRPLRLPTLLIGDSKLGGIATTISAFESLHLRGYDLDSVLLFDDPKWGNHEYLQGHFSKHGIPTHALPLPPPKQSNPEDDELALSDYYDACSASSTITDLIDWLQQKHFSRVSKLASMPSQTEAVVWHPFRQHGIPLNNFIAIDSAYGDHFQAYNPETDPLLAESSSPASLSAPSPLPPAATAQPLLTPLFDASASWWTQGLGHGNPVLSLTAAYAAGRYGHVMFAHAVHEPALDLSYKLLSTLRNPRLGRVFFTDNGSAGMEVAVKMALRASSQHYGWRKDDGQSSVGILGLKGSYHGDTIGVMNCSEPSPYNEKVDWYKPWGYWFDPPQILMRKGQWEIALPSEMFPDESSGNIRKFSSLDSIFDFESRPEDASLYKSHISRTLTHLTQTQRRRFGALILEPVVMGAGGMIFVDPLFQRTLITTIRENPSLINSNREATEPLTTPGKPAVPTWSGLPVIADEVFTGLYRLGRASSSSFLSNPSLSSSQSAPSLDSAVAPDISVHAKLLTGGLLPLALTMASESIFAAFLSDSKSDALLHGHSYTAHPVGCAVANKSLDELNNMDARGDWDRYKAAWPSSSQSPVIPPDSERRSPTSTSNAWSFFSPTTLATLSHHPRIKGCFALGTVLAITLQSPPGSSGYTSNAATSLQSRLLTTLDSEGGGIHSRVLGDVLYLMTSLTSGADQVERLEKTLLQALDMDGD